MTVGVAPWSRSGLESSMFIELHPCACGSADFDPQRQVRPFDGGWLSEYTGQCRGCGTPRQFAFRVSEVIPQLAPGAWSTLEEPSQLLDPAEWLVVADGYGAEHAALEDVSGLSDEQLLARLTELRFAAGAIDEVLLSVPAGADALPPSAVRSELGQRVYAADPSRFQRADLEYARDVYTSLSGDIQPGPDAWPLPARSVNEASLFTDMHRCRCGRLEFDRGFQWTPAAGKTRATLVYEGQCDNCGAERRFEFSVPADVDSRRGPDPLEAGYRYPGDGPSQLLDPAQFYLLAARCAGSVDQLVAEAPASQWRQPESWDAVVELLAIAVAAVDEVLAFVPAGTDRVPAAAFRSATGRVLHRGEPEIFLRDRLAELHAERDRLLGTFIAEHPPPDDEDEDEGE